jgi:hypothetical protein
MRFGIALQPDGPLAEPAALTAAARAADVLGYSSVWSRVASQLDLVVANTALVPVALVAPSRPDLAALRQWVAAQSRLAHVVSTEPQLLAGVVPADLLMGCAQTPASGVAGWAPELDDVSHLPAGWRNEIPARTLVLRLHRRPDERDVELAIAAGVDELIVALPDALTLDEQLAGFAETAELLASEPQPAD